MRKHRYILVDVFTDRPFGGNPLAIFPDARGIGLRTMQAIAKEFNLSETTFVLPPSEAGADSHVRIFTPAAELPIAGHPTVGTAFVMARESVLAHQQSKPTTMFLQEGVGIIAVTLDWNIDRAPRITMQQPLPTFGPRFVDPAMLASVLGLEPTDLRSDLPCEIVSCGVPFLLVPIKDLQTIKRISFQQGLWQQFLANFASPHILAFTQETQLQTNQTDEAGVHSRMFAPAFGISEDPATGAANGPLGSYLVHYGAVPRQEGTFSLISEQGFEIGHPSLMYITVEHSDRRIRSVSVGGHCVYMGEGELELDANE
jgi:trans-2,3-dihydro-3-hydroxyanthranilate isomerase